MLRPLALMALMALLSLPLSAQAEMIEGKVASVAEQGRVEITLPAGLSANPDDPVTLLTDIPGLGLTAISTLWRVEQVEGQRLIAVPEAPPTGTPQPGYVARIDSSAAQLGEAGTEGAPAGAGLAQNGEDGGTGHLPDIPLRQIDPSPAAENLYLAAQNLMSEGDFAQAAPLLRDAARQYHGHAMTELGALYAFGMGVPKLHDAALAWQELAAQYGEPDAYLRLGLMHLTGQGGATDIPLGSEMLHKAAAYGSAQGMYLLALLYEDGTGVPASEPEMVSWLRESADYGYAPAQSVVGQIYLDGDAGMPADRALAREYLTRAAENGQVAAMEVLAELLASSDPVQARYWRDAAYAAPPNPENEGLCVRDWECYDAVEPAAQAQQPAQSQAQPQVPGPATAAEPARSTREVQDCDRLAAHPYDDDRPDPALGVDYSGLDAARALVACEAAIARWPDSRRFHANLARVQHKLGQPAKAFDSAMVAAEMGSAQGMAFIATMYKSGIGVDPDAARAFYWFERSANAGNVAAMMFAASMTINPDSPHYDPVRAAGFYRAASEAGHADGTANLGVLFNNGQGVGYDPAQAARLLLSALERGSQKAYQELLVDYAGLSPDTRRSVQRLLQTRGLYSGGIDGAFGPATQRALRAVQRE
ncbi:SEL1-like repeat protein [Celeribacter neptunius]|uniref:TPR repeat n=1 Tax=Celeribacter neptunius TaxID=588602 RepID=A0A1I3VKH4_9RHOB|nr:SEL1-like repeat protein [Celeribacter neptunius]SFJ95924.1 TPR repeat [Celeribacter neptunius]